MVISATAAAVHAAHARIKGLIYETPLLPARNVGVAQGVNLFFKAENFQITGSFKLRGASNKLALLGPGTRAITASSGNHGIACSHAAQRTGAQLTVVVPEGVSAAKLAKIRSFGTEVILHGAHSGLAEEHARNLSLVQNIPYISPYNDADIIAGQGTAGLEMLRQHPGLDAVFVAMGGGGLVGGIGAVMKAVRPHTCVYGVAARASAALATVLAGGRLADVRHDDKLADGVAGGMDDDAVTLPIVRAVIDDVIWCDEDAIRGALRAFAHDENQIVEGAAALALAGFLQVADSLRGKNVAVVTCGANYDAATILPIIAAGISRISPP
jgi:threonine dehydratase